MGVRGKPAGAPTKPRQSAAQKAAAKAAKEAEKNAKKAEAAAATENEEKKKPGPAKAVQGHNSKAIVELDKLEREALTAQHVNLLRAATADHKEAAAHLKNIRKQIKDQGGKLRQVENIIKAGTAEGQKALLEEVNDAKIGIEWYTSAVQVELFPEGESRQPIVDKAKREGQIAALAGESCTGGHYAHGSEAGQVWMKSWHDTMEELIRRGIKPLHIDPAPPTAEEEGREPDALDAAIADVTGEPMIDQGLTIDEGASPEAFDDETPPPPAAELMPREEWTEHMREQLAAEERLVRDGTPIPESVVNGAGN